MPRGIRPIASRLRPPWIGRNLRVPRDDHLLAEFDGLWFKLGVTEKMLLVSDGSSAKLEDVADVRAGLDPSPHDYGGPLWGVWITLVDGRERGLSLFRPLRAARTIESQKAALAPTPRYQSAVLTEDWRVTVTFESSSGSQSRTTRTSAKRFQEDCWALRDVTINWQGTRVFLYSSTEAPAREAFRAVAARIGQRGLAAASVLERWDPVEQKWVPG